MRRKILLIFILFTTLLFSETISTKELKEKINKKNWIVLDTRSSDAFNGWRLEGEKREGHIKGATDFSANWLRKKGINKKDFETLNKRLKEKGITKDTNVVLYDVSGKDIPLVEKYLEDQGVKNIYAYNALDWINNTNLPMEKFKDYELLVPPVWVNDLINGKKPYSYNNDKYRIFEVSWGPINDALSYIRAHLKGAVHINTDEIEHAPLWSVNNDKDLIKFAKNNGININETVILYGEDVMASYRLAAILKYIGVKDVRVVNGGTPALVRDNIPMERGIVDKTPTKSIGTDKIENKKYIVGIDDAKKAIKDSNEQLIDIRSWKEYIGETSGYSYMDRKGRPDGSIWGDSGLSSNTLETYRNIDNTMRNGDEILNIWKNLGIDVNKKLVFFCGSGWRAAEVLIYSNVLGYDKNALYSNGWMEWSFDKSNPIILGE